jgi:hypothetical protein
MLREIKCSIFQEESVKFREGLNIVLGDKVASNSIGKSTFLMILDFIFGGRSYIDKNADVVSNISEHEFNYCFEFQKKMFYFKRGTENYQTVFICDKDYNPIDNIDIDKYTQMLKEFYEIDLEDISFRSTVSLYSRIWQKSNFDVKKPLHEVSTQKNQDVINNLIKLFNQYNRIKKLEDEIKILNDSQSAIKKAEKYNHIAKINKTIYNKNLREIETINIEMEKAALGISHTVADIINSINNELADELRNYKRQKLTQESKLNRIRKDLLSKESVSERQFQKLTDYFPSVNLEKLRNVERFHESISNILRDELLIAEKESLSKIEFFQDKIGETEGKLINLVSNKSISKEVMQPLIELSSDLFQRRNENSAYDKKQSVADDLKLTKEKLSLVKSAIIIEICNVINNKIEEYNHIVHEDGRRTPKIVLTENNYSYGIEDNTGTGEAYTNLIIFDLAILSLTDLPILIHDSMLFKNIENSSVENIIDIYSTFIRQIFISIDEIDKFNEKTKKIIQAKKVLEMSSTKLLFIKDWRKYER